MEVQRAARYPLHGRVQVALSNKLVLSGHTIDISIGGVCILLEDQIPLNVVFPIRFEMVIKGKTHVITAQARSIYGVFASGGGFRVGLAFTENDPHRSELIKSLAGKKPMVGNNVSHANNKTKRRFLPNLQNRKFWVESENRWVSMRITNAALRTIDKNGIDSVLADMRAAGEKV